jgi:hypothetical protein
MVRDHARMGTLAARSLVLLACAVFLSRPAPVDAQCNWCGNGVLQAGEQLGGRRRLFGDLPARAAVGL